MYQRKLLTALVSLFFLCGYSQSTSEALMPYPRSVKRSADKFVIDSSFKITSNADLSDELCYTAANHFYHSLMRRTGVVMKNKTIKPQPGAYSMSIKVQRPAVFSVGVDESYTLRIESNLVLLEAATSVGVVRGLATLQQLLERDTSGFYFPAMEINDAPRYAWRGLMIDVSRHFIPLDVLRRNIDAMSAVKLNVLHLHLTDDEGFRIESKQFPGLHLKGSDGLYYTQEEMKGLIRYAQLRGIMIVPEFDMPGHTRSWFAAHPELASAPGPYSPGPRFDVGLVDGANINLAAIMSAPTPTIDPTKESTYQFLEKFFREMAALFPAPYIHIGADENNGVAWKNNKDIAAFMTAKQIKSTADLQAYFVSRLHQIISKNNKQLIGWEELYHPGIPKDIIVQKWIPESPFMKGHGKPEEITAAGNSVIMSQGFYLDLFMPAYIHYLNPSIPAQPINKFLGGEAAIWTEIADQGNIDRRVWPRAAVVAERLWSPEDIKDVPGMYSRLFRISRQLDEGGIQHQSSYERALKRLALNNEWQELKILVDVLHPLRGYKNLMSRIKNPATLLNNQAALVSAGDWVACDSESRLEFRRLVEDFLRDNNAETAERIKARLNTWKNNHDLLEASGMKHSAYKELAVHSRNLKSLSEIGLIAVSKILSGTQFSNEELASFQNQLKEASIDAGSTTLAIIPEIESLVNQKLTPEPSQYPLF